MTSGRKKSKLLGVDQLERAIKFVADARKKEGVAVALAGGAAMQLYGSRRLTADVDFVSEGPLEALPSQKKLSFGGYVSETPDEIPVDVIVRDDDFALIYEEALHRAEYIQGVQVPVVTPEYMVIMKMVANRSKDHEDLDYLLGGEVDMNWRALETLVKKHLGAYGLKEYLAYREEAIWKASRTEDK